VLETALAAGGHGRLRLGDTTWAATGPDGLPAGARVRVVGAQGTVLRVEADGTAATAVTARRESG
jgi:membrane protein implicated in regulation of membrane protease activity